MKWVVMMSFDQTCRTAQKRPAKTVQALVDTISLVAGTAKLETKEVAEAVLPK
jgi:hypothetical protein